ncbi:hypothetical protein ACFV84_28625 [Kitasatospora sp. NPDC059811]|uniref:hypothetical protein n=1 Tax=Kitasatospora sp. NPDC059811 TaxID=3346957 RepID=UPI0007AF8790
MGPAGRVVGPDGIPVVLRLYGPVHGLPPDGGAAYSDGFPVFLVLAVLFGVVILLVEAVWWVRGTPRYRLSVEVGGPQPRSLLLGFKSRAQAEDCRRSLTAAIGEHGGEAVPRTPQEAGGLPVAAGRRPRVPRVPKGRRAAKAD